MNSPNVRIGFVMSALMISVALIYDGLKALIDLITFGFIGWLVNPFINIWAQMTFFFWFTFLGVSFLKPGKMLGPKIASMGIPSLIGLLPLVGDLPLWTSGVITNLAVVYAEDMVDSFSPRSLQTLAKGINKLKKGAKGARTPNEVTKEKLGITPEGPKLGTVKEKPVATRAPEKPSAEATKEKFDNVVPFEKPSEAAPRNKVEGINRITTTRTRAGNIEPGEIEESEDWPIAV
jgi:hypothetical protein